jgi:phosphoribosylformylglycinamidine (FGAM) synthase-like enzyme
MSAQVLENLKTLLQVPDLASKKWIYEQYDSQVMNDTIQTGGDAAIVRVHGTGKALALTADCTPRYVEADAFEGAKQAVAETYRNISAVGGKPLAITNCLNFGNPQKPEIMGQIVRAIQGITEACKVLDYPVVSGNVSLYNETDGSAIQPTPAIGGVGLLKDMHKRCDSKFKMIGDEILVIGKTEGHISCSLFERDVLKIENKKNPPIVDLHEEKKNAEFVRELIESSSINACHDISDGGLLVALFEMCTPKLGCDLDISALKNDALNEDNQILFAEDQSRYVVALDSSMVKELTKKAEKKGVSVFRVGVVSKEKIILNSAEVEIRELAKLNELVFEKNFS